MGFMSLRREAIGIARDEFPDNRYVLDVVKNGVPCTILDEFTPTNVCSWRKHKANDFQEGGGHNLFDAMAEIPRANASWEAHKDKKENQI